MKTKLKGFTLVELVIVIAIVIILSVVSVPIYRGYTRNAKMSEGYALLGLILSAQKTYYSQYGVFLDDSHSYGNNKWTCNDEVLGVDARGNKYFTLFNIGDWGAGASLRDGIRISVLRPEELCNDTSKPNLELKYLIKSGSTFIETENKYN